MKTFSSSMEKSVVDSSRLLEVAVLVCYSICFFHEVKQRCSQRQTEISLAVHKGQMYAHQCRSDLSVHLRSIFGTAERTLIPDAKYNRETCLIFFYLIVTSKAMMIINFFFFSSKSNIDLFQEQNDLQCVLVF